MKKQYPPQTGLYAVKVKTEQSTCDWKQFNNVRLQISIGQPYHEGDKFKATIDWCRNRFDNIQICVNDTLQRYNYMFENNASEYEAFDITRQLGNEWFARNKKLFYPTPVFEIVYWDEWKKNTEFNVIQKQINNLYNNNHRFKKAVDDNYIDLWKRKNSINPDYYNSASFERFATLSCQYILEEIAVFCLMFDKKEAVDIYPGTGLFVTNIFQDKPVPNAPSGISKRHYCRIDFLRNKNYSEYEYSQSLVA